MFGLGTGNGGGVFSGTITDIGSYTMDTLVAVVSVLGEHFVSRLCFILLPFQKAIAFLHSGEYGTSAIWILCDNVPWIPIDWILSSKEKLLRIQCLTQNQTTIGMSCNGLFFLSGSFYDRLFLQTPAHGYRQYETRLLALDCCRKGPI